MHASGLAIGFFALLLPAHTLAQDTHRSARRADPPPPCVVAAPTPAPGTERDSAARRAGFGAALERCMAAMHAAMSAALPITRTDRGANSHTAQETDAAPDPDRIFAQAMIPHHAGAIDMARFLLLYGNAPELRSFALKIIAEQQAEIDLLEQWLARQRSTAQDVSPPAQHESIPISARDRVYTADQVSNTVSVIDPSTNRLLGQIVLGNPRPDVLSPLYDEQANVHGLGFSPDGSELAVIATATNAVTLIDLATNEVRGTVYVARNPHEGFWTPDGRELWVTVRGESHVAVIDPIAMTEVARIETAEGPGMVVFRPDGAVAFVDHSFTAELVVVDVATRRVIRRIPVVSPFSPNLAVTADGREVWLTHKDVGKVTVIDAQSYEVLDVLDTGPVTNHVNFGGPNGAVRPGGATGGDFAYVTIGGENAVKVYRRSDRELVATIPVGAVPHGIWPSGDGTRMYAGLQQDDAVAVIDTRTNTKIAEIPSGQSPQALVYVPRALAEGQTGTANLRPIRSTERPLNIALRATADAPNGAGGTATVRSLGLIDGIEINLNGLTPGTRYTIYLADRNTAPFADLDPLAIVETGSDGRVAAEAYSAVRRTITRSGAYLVVLTGEQGTGAPVLVQEQPVIR